MVRGAEEKGQGPSAGVFCEQTELCSQENLCFHAAAWSHLTAAQWAWLQGLAERSWFCPEEKPLAKRGCMELDSLTSLD